VGYNRWLLMASPTAEKILKASLVVAEADSQALPGELHRQASPVKAMWARHSGILRLSGLVGILLFSFWVGMSPHWDYPYPLHVDEWIHISYAQSTLDTGGLEYPLHKEMGFHLLLGFLKTMTGVSWMSLYRIAPGVLLALLAFLVYAFGHRGGFGWAGALLVPLIPTSVLTLGPAFLVPVSTAMLFIPVTLLLLHTMEGKSNGNSLWVLLVLIGGTLFVHPTTEGVVTALAVLYLGTHLLGALVRRRFREGAGLLLAVGVRLLIPLVVLGFWLPARIKQVSDQSISADPAHLSSLGTQTGFLEAFGIVAVSIAILGIFFFIVRREYSTQSYILPLFTGLLLCFLLFFPRYGLGPVEIYYRGWSYLGLLLAIFSGYGVALYFRSIPAVARAVASRLRPTLSRWITVPLWSAGIAMLLFVLTTGLPGNEVRQSYAGYYHVVDDPVFADFRWIGQHTTPGQTVAMGEPSMGHAYSPVAGPGKAAFQAVSAPFTNPIAEKLRRMSASGEVDVPWLRKSGISLFYACLPQPSGCQEFTNKELFKVRRGVYLVPSPPGTK